MILPPDGPRASAAALPTSWPMALLSRPTNDAAPLSTGRSTVITLMPAAACAAARDGVTPFGSTGLITSTLIPRVIRSWTSLFCLVTSPLASAWKNSLPCAWASAFAASVSAT